MSKKKTTVTLLAGMAIGASLVGGAAAGIVAEPTWQNIYVDGQQVSMTAYNIAGNNYVRLRDIGQQVGFNVYWDNGVQIDTDASYTGIAPVWGAVVQPTNMEIREEMIRFVKKLGLDRELSALYAAASSAMVWASVVSFSVVLVTR